MKTIFALRPCTKAHKQTKPNRHLLPIFFSCENLHTRYCARSVQTLAQWQPSPGIRLQTNFFTSLRGVYLYVFADFIFIFMLTNLLAISCLKKDTPVFIVYVIVPTF